MLVVAIIQIELCEAIGWSSGPGMPEVLGYLVPDARMFHESHHVTSTTLDTRKTGAITITTTVWNLSRTSNLFQLT